MCKLYNQQLAKVQTQNGVPTAFRWRGRWYKVKSCSVKKGECSWRFRKAKPAKYRCETEQGLICDLTKNDGGWVLERIWD